VNKKRLRDHQLDFLRRITVSLLALILAASGDTVYKGERRNDDATFVAYFFTAMMPAVYFMFLILAVMPRPVDFDAFMMVGFVVICLSIFGLGSRTDRICERYAEEIYSRASSQRFDPNRGKTWARVRLFALVILSFLGMFAIAGIAVWRGP
jgi:hypothetical protein